MTNDKKPFGVVKAVPHTYDDIEPQSGIVRVGKKDPTVYAQYAFFRFHNGTEKLTFRCCGVAILGGLKAVAILSSLVGDMEIEDFKLGQHVDEKSKIHTKIEITVINPNVSASEPNSEISPENLVTHFE